MNRISAVSHIAAIAVRAAFQSGTHASSSLALELIKFNKSIMERVQLTENLSLIEIESVSVAGEGRIYECWFEFFGEEGRMIVSEKHIDEEDLNYQHLEITSEELFHSFDYLVENKHWPTIQKHIKAFIQYELEAIEE